MANDCEGLPATRKIALSLGARYYIGRPCKEGHNAPRRVSSKACLICEKAAGAAWRAANRDRANHTSYAWAARNPEKVKATKKANYAKGAGGKRAYMRDRRAGHPDAVQGSYRKWLAANIDQERERSRLNIKKWIAENPGRHKANQHNRRARVQGADGLHTANDVRRIRRAQDDRCCYCSKSLKNAGHIDHIKPIAKGGSNWPRNLQLLCDFCNRSKGHRDPIDFARARGMLL